MQTSNVLRIDELRVRREQRLHRALAMHRTDSERLQVVEHLAGVASLLGCDRAAAVWVDEYGQGLVHVHAILDLVSDTPRRRFPVEPLRLAWNDGVPGKLDLFDLGQAAPIPLHDAARSLCAVALGSDGARAWFLVTDGLRTRMPLDSETSGHLMFLAGECASVLLHRDLPRGSRGRPRERFAGWPILRDIDGREGDEVASGRIGGRFLVARALRSLVDEDLALEPAALAQQLEGVRRELSHLPPDDQERPLWDAVLRSLERGESEALARSTLALGKAVEDQRHAHGARELYTLSHAVAVAALAVSEAVESARLLGRLHRRQGEWDEAIRWYEGARAAARVAGGRATEAIVMDGLASAMRDKGNLPAARELLHEGLQVATESGDDYPLASVHHTLMTVEQRAGRLPQAVAHGWKAVTLHRQEETRYYVLVSLAGCLVKMGELDAAEDSYAVVAARVEQPDWRYAALETLAHISALRGHRDVFDDRVARADRTGWQTGASVPVHAQILQFRAMSWKALGELARARAGFEQARDYAQEHGINQVFFEAETLMAGLDDDGAAAVSATPATAAAPSESGLPAAEMAEIRGGVGAMRKALVPTFA